MNIVVISASLTDSRSLLAFFENTEFGFDDVVFVVVLPDTNSTHIHELMHLLSIETIWPVSLAENNSTLETGRIFVLDAKRHLIIKNKQFSDNHSFEKGDGPAIEAIWRSVSRFHQEAIAVALQPDRSYTKGIRVINDSGGLLLLQTLDTKKEFELDPEWLADFDYILSCKEMATVIKLYIQQLEIDEEEASPVYSPPASIRPNRYQINVPYLKDIASQHFMPGIAFLNSDFEVLHLMGKTDFFFDKTKFSLPIDILRLEPQDLGSAIFHLVEGLMNSEEKLRYTEASVEFKNRLMQVELLARKVYDSKQNDPLIMVKIEEIDNYLELSVGDELDSDDFLPDLEEELIAAAEHVSASSSLPSIFLEEGVGSDINDFGELSDDLNNLLQSSEIGTLYVDYELRIRKFTNSIRRHLPITNDLIGCSLGDLERPDGYPDLQALAIEVMESQKPQELTVENDSEWYNLRVHHYLTSDDTSNGVLFTFSKVTHLKRTNERLNQMSNELEQQGVELLKAMVKLKEEARVKEFAATELAKQKSVLSSVLNSMDEGVIAVDHEGKVFMLNQKAKQIANIEIDQLLLDWLAQHAFLCPLSRKPIPDEHNPFLKALNKETVDSSEIFVQFIDRVDPVFLHVNVQLLELGIEKSSSIVLVIRDITSDKLREIELRKSELTQKGLIDAVPDLMFRVNKNGEYLDYYPAKEESIVPAAAFVGNKISDVFPIDVVEKALNHLNKSLNEKLVETFRFTFISEDHRLKFYEARFSPTGEGEALCIVRDVTELMIANETVEKGSDYYRMLIDRCPAPIVLLQQDGTFVDINQAALEFIGASSFQDLDGKNIFSLLDLPHRTSAKNVIKRGFKETLSKEPATFKISCLNGEVKNITVAGSMMTYRGQLVIQAIVTEIIF